MLIVDEAHLLHADALTDLRLLISSAMDAAPPLNEVRFLIDAVAEP